MYNGRECTGLRQQIKSDTLKLDGNWGPWSDWTERTGVTNPEVLRRERVCNNPSPANEGSACEGDDHQSATVFKPINGKWSEWSEWSVPLNGTEVVTRERSCTNPPSKYAGMMCDGSRREQKKGLEKVEGGWGPWQPWSDLKEETNPESFRRERFCAKPTPANNGSYCSGDNVEERWMFVEIDGGWSEWGEWTDLKEGSSIVTRSRSCTNSVPIFNGKACVGPMQETKDVNKATNGNWGGWGEWSSRQLITNPEVLKRKRYCDNPTPVNEGEDCEGKGEEEMEVRTPLDGGWTEWSEWVVDDSKGTKTRARQCSEPVPAYGGESCEGDLEQEVDKNLPVNGRWTRWYLKRIIFRTKRNPQLRYKERVCDGVMNGGKDCEGNVYDCSVVETPIDGGWSEWGVWMPSPVNSQQLERSRNCTTPTPVYGGRNCIGVRFESRLLIKAINGEWGDWNGWLFVSKTRVRRTRKCDKPTPSGDGKMCDGHDNEQYAVYTAVDGEWNEWSEWINSTDSNTLLRTRSCNQPKPQYYRGECIGVEKETKTIGLLTDGGWGEWSPWSVTTKEENPENIVRRRYCNNPTASEEGSPCEGDDEESQQVLHAIDGQWSEWSAWLNLTNSASVKRTRSCNNPSPQFEGRVCMGAPEESNVFNLPRDGNWGPWSPFSPLTRATIPELVTRKRYCNNPSPIFNGKACEGVEVEEQLMFTKIDGDWSEWSLWSAADANSTHVNRFRSCTNPPPFYNGNNCEGAPEESKPLLEPVNGNWGPWGNWSQAIFLSNPEELVKKRFCDNPSPSNGGSECEGEGREIRMLYSPVDGAWSAWSEWVAANKATTEIRRRTCTKPAPLYEGKNCTGSDVESKDLFKPTNGAWTEWSPWSLPTGLFNPETLIRRRYCSNPTPANGGFDCEGVGTDTLLHIYPINGVWSEWQQWSHQTGSVNPEMLSRLRTCSQPAAAYGGEECEGDVEEKKEVVRAINGNWGSWSGWFCPGLHKIANTFLRNRECNNPTPQFDGITCAGNKTDVIFLPTRSFFFISSSFFFISSSFVFISLFTFLRKQNKFIVFIFLILMFTRYIQYIQYLAIIQKE